MTFVRLHQAGLPHCLQHLDSRLDPDAAHDPLQRNAGVSFPAIVGHPVGVPGPLNLQPEAITRPAVASPDTEQIGEREPQAERRFDRAIASARYRIVQHDQRLEDKMIAPESHVGIWNRNGTSGKALDSLRTARHASRMVHIPTAEELADILATILEGAVGGDDKAGWAKIVGPVEILPILTNVRSNWAAHPKGNKAKMAAIEAAVAIVREKHPYVKIPGGIEGSAVSRRGLRSR